MKVRFNVKGYIDRRGPRELEAAQALEQAKADKVLQARFEESVRRNEARRYFASLSPALPSILVRQAD